MERGSSGRHIVRAKLAGLIAGALLCASGGSEALAAAIEDVSEGAINTCPVPAVPLSAIASSFYETSKSSALLGGAPSALEAIRAQQALAAVPENRSEAMALRPPKQFQLAPAVGPVRATQPCAVPGLQAAAPANFVIAPQVTPAIGSTGDYLASRRIRIGRTNFDGAWKRVRSERITRSVFRRYLGSPETDRSALLNQVNSWANRHITYTEDKDQYGKTDFWAGARKTLKAARGDCEDIALAKMHLLLAAGVSPDDLIITIARDLVRRADHAVLIVRTGNRYVMLDNSSDEIIDASLGNDYRPVLSFGSDQTWLHGV